MSQIYDLRPFQTLQKKDDLLKNIPFHVVLGKR